VDVALPAPSAAAQMSAAASTTTASRARRVCESPATRSQYPLQSEIVQAEVHLHT
jgi:hypothetical protein